MWPFCVELLQKSAAHTTIHVYFQSKYCKITKKLDYAASVYNHRDNIDRIGEPTSNVTRR